MNIEVISLFAKIFQACQYGVLGRAITQEQLQLRHWNPRDYSTQASGHIDDRPYGGGPGMVMQVEPLQKAIEAAKAQYTAAPPVIYLSPQGQPVTQSMVAKLAAHPALVLVCGRYEGVDERLLTLAIDAEYAIGEFVVSGGEFPALMLIDAMARLLPGVLGHSESAQQDSFSQEGLLDHPHYTRPATYQGLTVPDVLRSGDHQAIAHWRHQQALGKTWQKRPDLLKRRVLTQKEQMLLTEYQQELADQP